MAVALAHLGVPTRFLSVVGDDQYGALAIAQLDEAGVDTSTVVVDPSALSGAVVILIDDQNERTIIPCALGAAYGNLSREHVDRLLMAAPKHLLLTGVALGADPTGLSYLHLARNVPAGTTLYFDPNLRQPAETVGPELTERFQEISRLADVVIAGEAEIAALVLERRAGQVFIAKAGAEGSVLTDVDGTSTHIPARRVAAVDTTGAGDAFAAGFVAARARGHDLVAAARYAAIAGALAVQSLGARVPTTWNQITEYTHEGLS
jgi:sugar/nucleoside kinase (ribokinase family)